MKHRIKIRVEHLEIERSEQIAVRQHCDKNWQEAMRALRPPNELKHTTGSPINFNSLSDKLGGIHLP